MKGKRLSDDEVYGTRYGKLVVVSEATPRYVGKNRVRVRVVLCKCDCGNEKEVVLNSLRVGHTKSCGCIEQAKKHGLKKTTEYTSWCRMMDRCYNPNAKRFYDWGGRGIIVCERWRKSCRAFIGDMGKRPSKEHTIDRIDNEKSYTCGKCDECIANGWELNVRWGTEEQQTHNKRNNVWLTYDGRSQIMTDWAREFGIRKNDLHYYLKKKPFELIAAKYELKNQLDRINKKYATL